MKRRKLLTLAAIVFVLFVSFCQFSHLTWRRGDWVYKVLPLQEWSFNSRYADGYDLKTHRGISTDSVSYGFISKTLGPFEWPIAPSSAVPSLLPNPSDMR